MRQTDVRQKHLLMPHLLGAGVITFVGSVAVTEAYTVLSVVLIFLHTFEGLHVIICTL